MLVQELSLRIGQYDMPGTLGEYTQEESLEGMVPQKPDLPGSTEGTLNRLSEVRAGDELLDGDLLNKSRIIKSHIFPGQHSHRSGLRTSVLQC